VAAGKSGLGFERGGKFLRGTKFALHEGADKARAGLPILTP
jgi:hypothetical protein